MFFRILSHRTLCEFHSSSVWSWNVVLLLVGYEPLLVLAVGSSSRACSRAGVDFHGVLASSGSTPTLCQAIVLTFDNLFKDDVDSTWYCFSGFRLRCLQSAGFRVGGGAANPAPAAPWLSAFPPILLGAFWSVVFGCICLRKRECVIVRQLAPSCRWLIRASCRSACLFLFGVRLYVCLKRCFALVSI